LSQHSAPVSTIGRSKRFVALATGVAAGLGLGLAGPAAPASAAPLSASYSVRTTSLGPDAPLPLQYVSNVSVDKGVKANPDVRTVVLVVHGDGRNAASYAENTLEAAAAAKKGASTAVIAPHFLATADSHANRMYWSSGGWKEGDPSLDGGHMSSFEVMDRLVARVQDGRFPNLDRIVVTGHSAGGQFTQRYAAGSDAPGVDEYVVANPSSYLYFASQRWVGSTLRALTRSETTTCSGYDEYKYGMQDRNQYMSRASVATLQSRYAGHHVTYLLGTADTSRVDDLDVTCAADLQGRTRIERGRNYVAYVKNQLGAQAAGHLEVEVPGVGHSWGRMVKSTAGRLAVFG
jgi:pimeloyl-ACP methyl ester carboxylesterase